MGIAALLLAGCPGEVADQVDARPGEPDGGISRADAGSSDGSSGADGGAPDAAAPDSTSPDSPPPFWSIGSYPGWVQYDIAPGDIDYSPFTHILHFAMFVNCDGTIRIGDIDQTAFAHQAVAAAHAASRRIVLVLGADQRADFCPAAAQAANRPTFVASVLDVLATYGYDGVSIDWEIDVDENVIALARDLRAAFDQLSPRPLLLVDVISGLFPPSLAAQLEPDVDSINIMSYWSSGLDELTRYTGAGVPAGKLILGIGISPDYRDSSVAHVQEKVDLIEQRGMRGSELWHLGDLSGAAGPFSDPRLEPLREMVAR